MRFRESVPEFCPFCGKDAVTSVGTYYGCVKCGRDFRVLLKIVLNRRISVKRKKVVKPYSYMW